MVKKAEPMDRRKFMQLAGLTGISAFGFYKATEHMGSADHEQEILEDELRKKYPSLRPVAQDSPLYKTINDLYEAIPKTLPETRSIPPKPKLYTYNDDDINLLDVPAQYSGMILISTSALEQTTSNPEHMKAMLAHELGHKLIARNPQLRRTPLNAAAIHAETERLSGGTGGDSDERRKRYMNELAADDVALRLTGDPQSLISMLENIYAQKDKRITKLLNNQIEATLKHSGRLVSDLPAAEMQMLMQDAKAIYEKDRYNNSPHPLLAVRTEAIRLRGEQMQKTKTDGSLVARTR